MKNKKGFTLVELLAVIVILALIMGIAVVSIGGVLTTAREKTYRETAASLINGVRQQLYIENKVDNGNYCFDDTILEKGGKESPYGGSFNYGCPSTGTTKVGGSIEKLAEEPNPKCANGQNAYVNVSGVGTSNVVYKICLSDGSHYIYATDAKLLDQTAEFNTVS